jgi:type IX secretion system PorP/SprF family membrane protein
LSDGKFISGGLSIGLYQTKLGANWVYIDAGDPTIPTSSRSQGGADVGIGFSLYKPGKYFVGASATHLAGPNLEDVGIQMARHYYVMGGYEASVNADITIRPNVMFKTDATSRQIDLNADVLFKKMVWGGLAYRFGDAIAPYVGFQKDFDQVNQEVRTMNHGIKLGYSYDLNTSVLKDYSAGSHEIFVTYSVRFTPIDNGAGHSNPRFL